MLWRKVEIENLYQRALYVYNATTFRARFSIEFKQTTVGSHIQLIQRADLQNRFIAIVTMPEIRQGSQNIVIQPSYESMFWGAYK